MKVYVLTVMTRGPHPADVNFGVFSTPEKAFARRDELLDMPPCDRPYCVCQATVDDFDVDEFILDV